MGDTSARAEASFRCETRDNSNCWKLHNGRTARKAHVSRSCSIQFWTQLVTVEVGLLVL